MKKRRPLWHQCPICGGRFHLNDLGLYDSCKIPLWGCADRQYKWICPECTRNGIGSALCSVIEPVWFGIMRIDDEAARRAA